MPFRSLLKLTVPLLLLSLGIFFLLHHSEPQHAAQTAVLPAPPPPKPIQYDEYGLRTDAFNTVERRIRRSQTFSEILGAHNISAETIHRLVDASKPVFDVRHLQAGDQYRVYLAQDTARYLVYRQNPVRYVVFDLRDSLRVYAGERPVTVEQRTVSGVIESSLYSALAEQDADPALAMMLAEMYAWQIDFYRIQRGDRFTVVYEQKLVDGEPVALGRITAARFNHYGEDYFGFLFEQDGFADYFDEEGNSLRKAFLKSPLKFSRITSHYTQRRFHPVQKRYKAHLGTDYAAPTGTPILAVGDGVVVEAQYKKYNGNYVKIRHNNTYMTQYLHMSKIGTGIRPGTRVRQGDVIGFVGSTGLATGPHVCFRFWKNGAQVNHLQEEIPPSNPVQERYRLAFNAVRDELLPLVAPNAQAPLLAARRALAEPQVGP